MSSSSSYLSSPKYGYDMVVGVTQASINGTMEEWLSKVDIKPFIIGYKYNTIAKKLDPIADWDAFVTKLGFDPFTVPNKTKASDPRMRALVREGFAFAFKAQIGLPDFPLSKIPPVITFDKEGSYVTYYMVNKVFEVIGIQEVPNSGSRYWLNLKQADGDKVWNFQFTVDLNLQEGDTRNYFHKLPPATQKEIKNLGENMFSVQQLFLDLKTARLSKASSIKGLDPFGSTFKMLRGPFLKNYLKYLSKNVSKNGGVMLGYSVQAKKPFPDSVSLIPTSLNFEISPYRHDGKPTTDYGAYTLNYLIMSNGNRMPVATPFSWNWVDKDNLTHQAGTMAINRNTFRNFLSKKLSRSLSYLAQIPDVYFSINFRKAWVSTSFKQDTSPQSFTNSNTGSTLLTYSYSNYDKDSRTHGNSGSWSIKYTSSSNISVSDTVITVVSKVNAYCRLEVNLGVTQGNWASYEITTTYDVDVRADGTLRVTQNDPHIVNNSEKPNPSFYSKLITANTIKHAVDKIQRYLEPLLEGWGTGFADDIANMLNGSDGWTFPGGKTYSFTKVQFSDHQDLVADLRYVTPKSS